MDVLCHKPARIQLSYLGYFGPTYLNCIDGWIGDKEVFGGLKENDGLLYVKGGYMAYNHFRSANIKEIRYSKKVTLGCFNNTRKLTMKTLDIFSKILNACPEAELMLKSLRMIENSEIKRIQGELRKRGVDDRQIRLMQPCETHEEHLAMYNSIDIALDTMPYGGATTSCEALAMGIPVITKRGRDFKSRLTSSLLVGCE